MILTLEHSVAGSYIELVGGEIVTNDDKVLLSSDDSKSLSHFLDLAKLKAIGETTTNGDLLIVYKNTEVDCEFVYKPFTSKEELETENLLKVVANVNDIATEGYIGFEGRNIIVYHYAKELGNDKLEKLSEEFLGEDLEGLLHIHREY